MIFTFVNPTAVKEAAAPAALTALWFVGKWPHRYRLVAAFNVANR